MSRVPILPLADRKVALEMSKTVGGWALLINSSVALLLLLYQVASGQAGVGTLLIGAALSLLLIVGMLALWPLLSGQERFGHIGIVCMCLATGIAFFVRLALLLDAPFVSAGFPVSSAVLGFVGSVLVGWATMHTKIFHPLIGWLLMTGGALNLVGGLIAVSGLMEVFGIISTLAQAVALAGYGWTLLHVRTMEGHASLGQA